MDASRLASFHKQAVLAPCEWRWWLLVPTVKLFHGWDAWLPDEIQLPPTFKKKSKLKETREENETSTQRNKDRSDFTLKQRLTQRCKGERKRKGWVQNASKAENAEVDVREWGKAPQRYHQNWLVFHPCHRFSYLACHLVLKAPFTGALRWLPVCSTAASGLRGQGTAVVTACLTTPKTCMHCLFLMFVVCLQKGVLSQLSTWSTDSGLWEHLLHPPCFQSFAVCIVFSHLQCWGRAACDLLWLHNAPCWT